MEAEHRPVLTPVMGRVMNLLKGSLLLKTNGKFEKGV